jgi:hypothetical protein
MNTCREEHESRFNLKTRIKRRGHSISKDLLWILDMQSIDNLSLK